MNRTRATALMTILTLVAGAAPLCADWSVEVTVDCDDGMNIWPEGPHVGTGPTVEMAEEDGRQMACYMCENLGGLCGDYTYDNYQEVGRKKGPDGSRTQRGYSFRFRFPMAATKNKERDVVGLGDTLFAAYSDARKRADRSMALLGGDVVLIRKPKEEDAIAHAVKGQISAAPFKATGSPGDKVTIKLTNKGTQPIGLNVFVGDADDELLEYVDRITIPAAGEFDFEIVLKSSIKPHRFPIGFRTDDRKEFAHIIMEIEE